MEMTERQLHIIQHSVGADKFGRGSFYRNHYCASSEMLPICQQLVEMGLMRQMERSNSDVQGSFSSAYTTFEVTEKGFEAMMNESAAFVKQQNK